MQNRARIKFLYAEKERCPLAYLRSSENETILVLLNPSNQPQSFPCELTLTEELYHFNALPQSKDGKLLLAKQSAAFYRLRP